MRIVQLFFGNGGGGDAAVAFELHRQYRALGHDAELYAYSDRPEVLSERAHTFGVDLVRVGSWLNIPAASLEQADAVHLHTSGEYLDYVANLKPLRKRIDRNRLFCTVHGPRPLEEAIHSARKVASAMLAAASVRNIIVPSEHKVREWSRRLVLTKNVVRIANPIPALSRIPRSEAREKLGLPRTATIAAFVGLLRPEKGALIALEAAQSFRSQNVHFAFAGSGPQEALCRSYVQDHNLAASFHGYLSDPGLLLSAADVFLFPSIYENFPISLMQAALTGLPIVVSNLPVVADELAGSESVAVFAANDAQSMAVALESLLSRDVSAQAQRLSERIAFRYDPLKIATEHIALFMERSQTL